LAGVQFWNRTFESDDWGFGVEEIRQLLDGGKSDN